LLFMTGFKYLWFTIVSRAMPLLSAILSLRRGARERRRRRMESLFFQVRASKANAQGELREIKEFLKEPHPPGAIVVQDKETRFYVV